VLFGTSDDDAYCYVGFADFVTDEYEFWGDVDGYGNGGAVESGMLLFIFFSERGADESSVVVLGTRDRRFAHRRIRVWRTRSGGHSVNEWLFPVNLENVECLCAKEQERGEDWM
jgi:hypothetical protein